MEGERNDREIIHCASVRDSFVSCLCTCTMFLFPGSRKELAVPTQHPSPMGSSPSSFRQIFSVSWCETAASSPESSQIFTCLPATQLQATLPLAGVGEPGFPSNQEEKVTCEMMESKGSWNCYLNRAFILVCPIPQGAGCWKLRMRSLCTLAYRHFTGHSWGTVFSAKSLLPDSCWAEASS